jgi:hypothetical protein
LNTPVSILVGLPENAVRVRNVGHALTVFGEDNKIRGNAPEKRLKLL